MYAKQNVRATRVCICAIYIVRSRYGPDGETYNAPFDRRFVGYNKTYIQELCHNPVWVPTCANACYMSSGGDRIAYDRTYDPEGGGTAREVMCREHCDWADRKYSAEGSENDEGWNFPPGGTRHGYGADGGWSA